MKRQITLYLWMLAFVTSSGLAAAGEVDRGEFDRRTAACTAAAKGKFLIAKRDMADPRFAESVILLIDYDEQGALGLIINRRSEIRLAAALPQIAALQKRNDMLFFGGPVSPRTLLLLVRSSKPPADSVRILDTVYFAPGVSLLESAISSKDQTFRAYGGYAGWAPGQLDKELERGDWYVADAEVSSIFSSMPASIWPGLINHFEGQWAMAASAQTGC